MSILDDNTPLVVKSEPLFSKIYCNDDTHRKTGQIRLSPTLIKELTFSYEFEKLANQPPTMEGLGMFQFDNHGLVFNELDYSHQTDLFDWDTLWITTPVEYKFDSLPSQAEYNKSAFYAPDEELYVASYTKKNGLQAVEVIDLENNSAEEIQLTDITFFEVPDAVIYHNLPPKYTASVTAQTI